MTSLKKSELEELPAWAQVALAVRAAQRVFRLYAAFESQASNTNFGISAVRDAIRIAQELAGSALFGKEQAKLAHAAARSAGEAGSGTWNESDPRPWAAFAATQAASAAGNAADGSFGAASCAAFAAIEQALKALDVVQPEGNLGLGVLYDYKHLRRISQDQSWTNETPVPQSVFENLEGRA
ncbi:MAG TPA: hypothetical protein DDW52_29805 [Planctomycetaceae bacterium]|nr:hypothetical protein [Planctomycetaceae bacterium]